MIETPLRMSSVEGGRWATPLYSLLPGSEEKAVSLLSFICLTVAERRWATEHRATARKPGRFFIGGKVIPRQSRLVRRQEKGSGNRSSVRSPAAR